MYILPCCLRHICQAQTWWYNHFYLWTHPAIVRKTFIIWNLEFCCSNIHGNNLSFRTSKLSLLRFQTWRKALKFFWDKKCRVVLVHYQRNDANSKNWLMSDKYSGRFRGYSCPPLVDKNNSQHPLSRSTTPFRFMDLPMNKYIFQASITKPWGGMFIIPIRHWKVPLVTILRFSWLVLVMFWNTIKEGWGIGGGDKQSVIAEIVTGCLPEVQWRTLV